MHTTGSNRPHERHAPCRAVRYLESAPYAQKADASDSKSLIHRRYGQNVCGIALGRKNYLFCGSNSGGERAAAIYSLVGSAKLNELDPERYPSGLDPHRRAPGQPHRRTAPLEPRRRRQYRHSRTLLTGSQSVHLK